SGFLFDNTGENIADRRPHYDELAALYWGWKNLNGDIFGLYHYRRYLNHLFSASDSVCQWTYRLHQDSLAFLTSSSQRERIEELLSSHEMIVPQVYDLGVTMKQQYDFLRHPLAAWDCMLEAIEHHCHDLMPSMLMAEQLTAIHLSSLMICRRSLLSEYCETLFKVIDFVVDRLGVLPDIPGERFQPTRYPSYLAERFLNAWIISKQLKKFESQ
ncbi:MAG: DUF4422 domain-containing protein, partial [Pirellula sp.]